MKIINKLVKNQPVLENIENQFINIAEELANINEFPIHIPRFFSPEKENNTKIGLLLKEVYLSVCSLLESIPLDVLIKEINQIDKLIIFLAEGPDKKITKDSLIIHIIAKDLESYTLKIAEYIDIPADKQKVFQQIPSLKLDKYNLTAVTNDFKLEKHGIIYKNKFLIYYHPLLRRFYTSNFTIGELLKNVSIRKDISLKIAIDPLRISEPHYLKQLVEADYWRGPIFAQEKLNNPHFTGITVYARNAENQQILDLTWPVKKTIFYITNKKELGLKQIEIEEINPQNDKVMVDNKYVLQKYAHLIWDANTNTFNHFDVAVKVYSLSEHSKRLRYDWETRKVLEPGKTISKIKLFRLDGKLEIDLVLELLGDFFRYNELINEFFEGSKISIPKN